MLIVVHYCYRFLCTVVTDSCALLLPFFVHSPYHFLCTRRFCLHHDIAIFLTESSDFYRKWIKEFLGGHWTLSFLHGSRLEFAVVDPQNEDRLVFGQTIQIWFERRDWKGEERFETNIGSTGGFDILAAGQGDRARFYIDLGRFLADTQRMAELKEMLFDYKDSLDALYKTRDGIEKELNEPELS